MEISNNISEEPNINRPSIIEKPNPHLPPHGMKTRGQGINPGKYANATIKPSLAYSAKKTIRTEANPTLLQARNLAIWLEWKEAIDNELNMLKELGCYEEIKRHEVPHGKQILQSKIDLKVKVDSQGKKIKNKARLVALGNLEWENIRDVYAPTVNAKTINLLFALAAQNKMLLYGLDIFGAFITADIDNPVYLQLPQGLISSEQSESTTIWRLKKTLYGLNRAPKAFYDDLSKFLITNGYKRSPLDPCLFHSIQSNGDKIIFCVHVDDFAIAATSQDQISRLCDILKTKYTITESDNLESFLGIHIVKDKDTLYLSQPGHIQKICNEAQLTATEKFISQCLRISTTNTKTMLPYLTQK
jgi:hypothetical protein